MNYMTVDELKARIDVDASVSDDNLQIRIDDTAEYIMKDLNNKFLNDKGVTVLPGAIKKAIAKMINLDMTVQDGISSQSVEGLSVSYQTATGANGMTDVYGNVRALTEPYRISRSGFRAYR